MAMMYNKLFTKILDSSIWLAPDAARIVWLTFLAAMDEDGVVRFASVANVAHRARVSLEAATGAVRLLESPDADSSDPDNEGRRVERVPGGWVILNAEKYRDLVTRVAIRAQTKERVRRHREKQRNASVTLSSGSETQSRSRSKARSDTEEETVAPSVLVVSVPEIDTFRVPACPFQELVASYHEHCPSMSRVQVLTNMRMKHARARWVQVCTDEKWNGAEALEWFGSYFKMAQASPFLTGRSTTAKRAWKADFEWLMNAGNFAKVVEGKYHEDQA
jgi:hypothetical protein